MRRFALIATLLLSTLPLLAQNLVTNGSFDSDISGWKATAGASISWVGFPQRSMEVTASGPCLENLMWSNGLPPGAYQKINYREGFYTWGFNWELDSSNPANETRLYVCVPMAEEGQYAITFVEKGLREYNGGIFQPLAQRLYGASNPGAYVVVSPCNPDGTRSTARFDNIQLTFERPACSIYSTPSVPLTGVVGKSIRFQSSISGTCTGAIQHYWDFGDFATSTSASPSHTYAAAGTFDWRHTMTSGEEVRHESGKIIVLSNGIPTADKFWKVFETEPDLSASPPNLGAVVYATPFAVGDPQFVDAAAGAAMEFAGMQALELLLRSSTPLPIQIIGAVAEALKLIDIFTDPTRIAPIGQNLAVVGSSVVRLDITPANDQLSTWVAIDFVGTRFLPVDLTQIGQPLMLEYQQQAGLSPNPIARVLLTAPDLARLANESKRITYIVVPKTPVSVSEIPNGGLRIFQTPVVNYKVSAKVGSLFGASTSFDVHTGAADLLTQIATVGSSQPASVTPPRPRGRKRAKVALQFEATPAKMVDETADGCTATIAALDAVTRASLATRTIPADGMQNVDLGDLPDRDWILEISAPCSRTVVVTFSFEEPQRARTVRR